MGMTKAELMRIPLRQFGLPKERKFPMHDEAHLKAAIAYFYTAPPEKRKELAENIVRRWRELKSNIKISKRNPLFQYIPGEMKNLQESGRLFENVNPEHFERLFGTKGREIVESLLSKTGLTTVDDIDSQVPDEYRKKNILLGALKSYIINEMGENYPVLYMDYPVSSKDLKKNNGGIKTLSETSIILDYRNTLNECSSLDVVSNMEHIQFCALLREWDENYMNGHRNITYDRLMIESWKSRVYDLLTENHDPNHPGTLKLKPINHIDIETKQKLADLGVINPDEFQKVHITGNDIHEKSPIVKSAEIGFNIVKDIVERYNADNPNVTDGALSLKLYTYSDDVKLHQRGEQVMAHEMWRWE
jgi:hypothetical protein